MTCKSKPDKVTNAVDQSTALQFMVKEVRQSLKACNGKTVRKFYGVIVLCSQSEKSSERAGRESDTLKKSCEKFQNFVFLKLEKTFAKS